METVDAVLGPSYAIFIFFHFALQVQQLVTLLFSEHWDGLITVLKSASFKGSYQILKLQKPCLLQSLSASDFILVCLSQDQLTMNALFCLSHHLSLE